MKKSLSVILSTTLGQIKEKKAIDLTCNEETSEVLLKSRKAKVSQRGVYIQDKALQETVFQPGSHYRYVIDTKSKKIVILGSDDSKDNTVSRRHLKTSVKPVIDIRDRDALSAFEGCDYLQVEIFGQHVIVQGYVNAAAAPLKKVTQAVSKVLGFKCAERKIVEISDLLAVKKKAEIVMSRKSLKRAAGLLGYEQLELDLFFGNSEQLCSTGLSKSRNTTSGSQLIFWLRHYGFGRN